MRSSGVYYASMLISGIGAAPSDSLIEISICGMLQAQLDDILLTFPGRHLFRASKGSAAVDLPGRIVLWELCRSDPFW